MSLIGNYNPYAGPLTGDVTWENWGVVTPGSSSGAISPGSFGGLSLTDLFRRFEAQHGPMPQYMMGYPALPGDGSSFTPSSSPSPYSWLPQSLWNSLQNYPMLGNYGAPSPGSAGGNAGPRGFGDLITSPDNFRSIPAGAGVGSGAGIVPSTGAGAPNPFQLGPTFNTASNWMTAPGGLQLNLNPFSGARGPGGVAPPLGGGVGGTHPFQTGAAPWGGGAGGGAPWQNPVASMLTGTPAGAGAGAGAPGGSSVDQFLANLGNDMSYLRDFAQNGQPIDVMPGWNAMVAAQQRNIGQNAAQLNEYFNTMGGRFSTGFGSAMGDYYNQASLNQNALLAQMQQQALESARNRQFGAASSLAGYAFQGPSQLSSQEWQSGMQANQLGLNAALGLMGGADAAALALAQGGQYGAGMMNQNAAAAAQMLYGGELGAAQGLFQNQNQLLPQFMNRDLAMRQLGLGAAGQLGGLGLNWLNAGANLGTQQYGILQDQINRSYQEWLRTQPYYHPFMPYWFGTATSFPPMQTGSVPTFWDYFSQIAAAGLGAAGQIIGGRQP